MRPFFSWRLRNREPQVFFPLQMPGTCKSIPTPTGTTYPPFLWFNPTESIVPGFGELLKTVAPVVGRLKAPEWFSDEPSSRSWRTAAITPQMRMRHDTQIVLQATQAKPAPVLCVPLLNLLSLEPNHRKWALVLGQPNASGTS
mmetsp:Transcript_22425/g.35598  ORF Transcript_22425/g.35598 Transcript_22425/m.35598 type:complete len:143 (-) Transcript_22425:880-1308(-)